MDCGYIGVTHDPARSCYKARIHFEGKEHYIGRFDTAYNAALAYDQAARLINTGKRVAGAVKRRRRPINYPDVIQDDPKLQARLEAMFADTSAATAAAGQQQSQQQQGGAAPADSRAAPMARIPAHVQAAAAAAADFSSHAPAMAGHYHLQQHQHQHLQQQDWLLQRAQQLYHEQQQQQQGRFLAGLQQYASHMPGSSQQHTDAGYDTVGLGHTAAQALLACRGPAGDPLDTPKGPPLFAAAAGGDGGDASGGDGSSGSAGGVGDRRWGGYGVHPHNGTMPGLADQGTSQLLETFLRQASGLHQQQHQHQQQHHYQQHKQQQPHDIPCQQVPHAALEAASWLLNAGAASAGVSSRLGLSSMLPMPASTAGQAAAAAAAQRSGGWEGWAAPTAAAGAAGGLQGDIPVCAVGRVQLEQLPETSDVQYGKQLTAAVKARGRKRRRAPQQDTAAVRDTTHTAAGFSNAAVAAGFDASAGQGSQLDVMNPGNAGLLPAAAGSRRQAYSMVNTYPPYSNGCDPHPPHSLGDPRPPNGATPLPMFGAGGSNADLQVAAMQLGDPAGASTQQQQQQQATDAVNAAAEAVHAAVQLMAPIARALLKSAFPQPDPAAAARHWQAAASDSLPDYADGDADDVSCSRGSGCVGGGPGQVDVADDAGFASGNAGGRSGEGGEGAPHSSRGQAAGHDRQGRVSLPGPTCGSVRVGPDGAAAAAAGGGGRQARLSESGSVGGTPDAAAAAAAAVSAADLASMAEKAAAAARDPDVDQVKAQQQQQQPVAGRDQPSVMVQQHQQQQTALQQQRPQPPSKSPQQQRVLQQLQQLAQLRPQLLSPRQQQQHHQEAQQQQRQQQSLPQDQPQQQLGEQQPMPKEETAQALLLRLQQAMQQQQQRRSPPPAQGVEAHGPPKNMPAQFTQVEALVQGLLQLVQQRQQPQQQQDTPAAKQQGGPSHAQSQKGNADLATNQQQQQQYQLRGTEWQQQQAAAAEASTLRQQQERFPEAAAGGNMLNAAAAARGAAAAADGVAAAAAAAVVADAAAAVAAAPGAAAAGAGSASESGGGDTSTAAPFGAAAGAGVASGAAAAAAAGSGFFVGVGCAELLLVTNCCLHEMVDLRLAVLTAPRSSSCMPALQHHLDTTAAPAANYTAHAQQGGPAGVANAAAGAAGGTRQAQGGTAGAAPPGEAQSGPNTPAERVVARALMRLFCQMVQDHAYDWGQAQPAAELQYVLGCFDQLQDALAGLQRIAAGPGGFEEGGNGRRAASCLAEWVEGHLGLPYTTHICPAVVKLATMM